MLEVLSNQAELKLTPDALRLLATAGDAGAEIDPSQFRAHRLPARFGREQTAAIIERYQSGESATAIATSLDVAPSALLRLLREHRVVVRQSTRVTAELGAVLAQEYQAGATMAMLQEKYRISHGAVYRALHRQGVEIRPKGRPRKPTQ